MKLSIVRLDYRTQDPIFKTFDDLPTLNKVTEITDINEVHEIIMIFEDMEEAKCYLSHFPKYLKLKIDSMTWIEDGKWKSCPRIYKRFNTFWMNGTTSDANETAVKQRNKMIEILDNLS